MTVATKIKTYLVAQHITQQMLSQATGIPLAKLNLSLNDNRKLTFDEFELILGALGVTADKFITPKLNSNNQC